MSPDYEVLIPSRKRADRLVGWKKLFPFARLYVHESEHDDYARIVGEQNVVTHSKAGLWSIHKEMILKSERETVVSIDDDVCGVWFFAGDDKNYSKVEDPEHVRQIIENACMVAKDTGVELFGWDLHGKMQYFDPHAHIGLTSPCDTAFGVVGKKLLPDESFWTSGGFDLNLQALMQSRVVLCDRRYWFNNGKVGGGSGGLQGMRTAETELEATAALYRKWGAHVNRAPSKAKGQMGGFSMSVRVGRKNPLASTR